MVTENQTTCFMIIILAAVFLMFYHSSNNVKYRGTACSARKTDDADKDAKNVSARAVGEDDEEDTDPSDPMGFVPMNDDGEAQFKNSSLPSKTRAEISQAEAAIAPMRTESSRARFVGMSVTGTVASCSLAGEIKVPPKPKEDCMFLNYPEAAS